MKSGINPYISTDDLRCIPGPEGVSAIIYAAAQADIETVKEFLAKGVSLRKKNVAARYIMAIYLRADPLSVRYPQTETEKTERLISERAAATINFMYKYKIISESYVFAIIFALK